MNTLHLPENPDLARTVIESQVKERELGWLGYVFGSNPNTASHIVGLLLLILVMAGITYTFVAPKDAAYPPGEFWKILSPLIGTLVGYFLGSANQARH